ncbi:MAG: hypothetical protein HZC42_09370 [Candidatus Eisenbacteria bacterium]|nr:hypothetical protein [Candidatus Eisenbacteria bacterium]
MTTPSAGRTSPLRGFRLPFLAIALGLPALAAAGTLAIDRWTVDGGDIVLMRPGSYLLSSQLSKPLTLRATRKGPAVITP